MAEAMGSTKPYMIRAIHEWCVDNALTPHLLVVVNAQTNVPKAFVKNGEIVLNLSYAATKDLQIDNDAIVFSARFGGVAQNLYVPISAVRGIFARENGQGMFFEIDTQAELASDESETETAPVENEPKQGAGKKRPTLTIVK